MFHTSLTALVPFWAALASCFPHHSIHNNLLVKTESFAVQGTVWPNNSAAHFYGNIPYAEPPVGGLRWRPPVTRSPSAEVINGSWFGPSCIQYSNGEETAYTEYLTGFLISPGQTQSEDCLTLNVWAPKNATKSDKLPVMIWIHGGGFTSGGAASQYKYGDRLASDQNVIVVALNYRLNIFGYPNAAALNGRNLNPGLLDQRKAVEWVYQSIYAFGGDAEQMTLFGQSAGGIAVDFYTYAYPFDPLVQGFIPQSGVATSATPDRTGSNFTYVASRVDAQTIIEVYNSYNATLNGGKALSFSPTADNLTRFENYTDLQTRGLFAHRPTIYSMVNNEGNTLLDYDPAGVNQTAAAAFTASFANCPGDAAAAAKASFGVPVWRTRYFGTWPNLNPLPWLGAFHSSDLPMIFGTSDLRGPDTAAETATSKYYQGAWAAFARDPSNGLKDYGWPTYDPNGRTLIELGLNGSTSAVFVESDTFQSQCQA
ncbi:hypothetical protein M409DRAFT_68551 [Zasmidium cellare ATCC 36951]|uniref:Carboxylic ester hydrolase n=1 Tax=Zasmidium cellare ATCC 36951 TaxID=1080233 RepID=A0A6A6CC50_ZASCE|nr:uncharacterized protein M409DRAFT_68551 [Zasmidium cellare ATCC 36951]KAF2163249.1 hypothetical protein M409DRAFT_68551 [Zasmidium cellare ATCC 36951]